MQSQQKHAYKTLCFVCMMISLLGIASISWAQGSAWTMKRDMPEPRHSHCACVVDGKIYVTGGGIEGSSVEAIDEYDPATDIWTKKTSMGYRSHFSTSVVDGKIYIIGGGDGSKLLLSVEEYDPATDTWTTKTDIPTARWFHSASVVDGKIYVMGGWEFDGGMPLADVDEYNPTTNIWTKKTPMPTARHKLSTNVVDGKVYAIGGGIWSGLPTDMDIVPRLSIPTVEEYDPVNNTWTTRTDMPTPREWHAASVVDGKIYVTGGWKAEHSITLYLSSVEEYDPATDTWTTKTDISTARYAHSASVVDGKIYVMGGLKAYMGAPHPIVPTVEVYDPALDPLVTSIQTLFWGALKATFR